MHFSVYCLPNTHKIESKLGYVEYFSATILVEESSFKLHSFFVAFCQYTRNALYKWLVHKPQ